MKLSSKVFTYKFLFFYFLFFIAGALLAFCLQFSKKTLHNVILAQSQLNSPVTIDPENINYSFVPLGASFKNISLKLNGPLKNQVHLSPAKKVSITINPFYLLAGKIKISHLKISGLTLSYKHKNKKANKKGTSPSLWIQELLKLPIQKLSLLKATAYMQDGTNKSVIKNADLIFQNKDQKSINAKIKADSFGVLSEKYILDEASLKIAFLLSQQKLEVKSFSTNKNNSFIEVKGSVNGDMNSFKYQKINLNMRSSADLSDFKELVPSLTPFNAAEGLIKAEIQVNKENNKKISYNGSVNSSGLSIDQYHLGQVSTQITGIGNQIKTKNLNVLAPGANIDFNELSLQLNSKLNVSSKININDFELQQYLKNLNIRGVPMHMRSKGSLTCSGHLKPIYIGCKGQSHTDHLDLVFREPIRNSLFQSFDIKNLFDLTLTKKGVQVNTQLSMEKAKAEISGFVDFKKGYDLKFDTQIDSIEDSFRNLANLKMKGSLAGKGHFVGDTHRGQLSMKAQSANFMLDNFILGNSGFDLTYDKNILDLKNVKTKLRDSSFNSNISIDLNNNSVQLEAKSKKAQVQDLFYSISNHLKLPVKVSGYGQFNININGPIKINKLNHKLDAKFYNLFVGEENFDNLKLKTSSINGNLTSQELTLTKANSLLKGYIDLRRDGLLNASLSGTPIELQSLDILNNRNYRVDGLLEPLVVVSNYIYNPEYNVNLKLKKVYYNEKFYNSTYVSFRYSDKLTSGESLFLGENKVEWYVPFTNPESATFSAKLKDFNFTHLLKIILGANHLTEYNSSLSADIQLNSKSDYLWNSDGLLNIKEFRFNNGTESLATNESYAFPIKEGRILNQSIDLSNKKNILKIKLNELSKNNLNIKSESNLSLSLLQIVFPFVENLKGHLISFFDIKGPFHKPQVRGNANLKDGFFNFESLPHSVSQLNSELKIRDDKFFITSLSSEFAGGKVIGSGHLKLDLPLIPINIKLKGKDLNMEIPEGMSTQGDGELQITGSQSPYLFSGHYNLRSGAYNYNFDSAEESQEIVLANKYLPQFVKKKKKSSLLLDFNIETKSAVETNLIINGSQTRVSMEGELKVHGELEKLNATGKLISTNTGELIFRENNFDILSAVINYDNQDITDPQLNIKTQTLVVPKNQDNEINETYNISMEILGTAQDPSLTFSSQPLLSEDDILSLIAVGVTSQDLDEDIDSGKQALKASYEVGTEYIKSKLGITKALKKRTGLEVNLSSTLDVEDENAAATKFNIKKQFSENLEVSASQTEGSSKANDMELRYKINDQISLSSQWERQQDNNSTSEEDTIGVGVEYQIEFD